MATSNISVYENSQQDGQPIECYRFTVGSVQYQYTSHHDDIAIVFSNPQRTETYVADYIKREAIKPGSKGDSAQMIVTVSKDHVIANMFKGPPPENKIKLQILRLHKQDNMKFDIIFTGRVSQAAFEDSECNLTVKMESFMAKQIPNGMRQFTCNNVIYDSKCRLKEADLEVTAFIDKISDLDIFSTTFANYPDGYFANGFLRWNGYVRQIIEHKGQRIQLKYPFVDRPNSEITAVPGCDQLFSTCHTRFGNTLNFSGCPYVSPTNPEHTAVGKGVYWINSQVIQRDTDGYVGTITM